MKLFEIFGEIKIDGADKAEKEMDSLDKKGLGLSKVLGGVGKAFLGAGVAVGGAAAALGGMAKKSAEATDRIDKMSQKLGLSRQGFQEWDFILSQNGASIDSMGAGMKTLTNQVDELASGNEKAAETFERIGLDITDLQGLTQEDIFETVIMQLQDVSDEGERAALANDLLGRSGQELAPLLNIGANALFDMKQQAHDLGLVMGDEAVDAGVKFTDTMDQLKRSFGVVVSEVGVAVMPMFQKMAEWVISNMPTIQAVFDRVFGVISNVVTIAFDVFNTFLFPMFKTIFDWVLGNLPTIKETFNVVFSAIVSAAREVWAFFSDNIMPIIQTFFNFIKENFPTIQSTFQNVFGAISTAVQLAWDIFKGLWAFVEPTFPLIGETIETAFKVVTGVVEGAITTFRTLVGWIRDAINWINSFNSTKINETNTSMRSGFGGISGEVRGIIDGARANGGTVNAGGTYLVGERGPELFAPNQNGTIVPNHSLGGQIVVNISNPVMTDRRFVDEMGEQLVGILRNKGVLVT